VSPCLVCGAGVDAPYLTDPATGSPLHPACLARGAAQDTLLTVLGLLVLTLGPSIVVWAG